MRRLAAIPLLGHFSCRVLNTEALDQIDLGSDEGQLIVLSFVVQFS